MRNHGMIKVVGVLAIAAVLYLTGAWGCDSHARRVDAAAIEHLATHYDDAFEEHLAAANLELGTEIVHYEPIAPDVFPHKMTIRGTHREVGRWIGTVVEDLNAIDGRHTHVTRG